LVDAPLELPPAPPLFVVAGPPQPAVTASKPATINSAISFFTTIILSVEK